MLKPHDKYQIVRNFLFSSVNKEFLIFLFFLGLSGTFWLIMTMNESYEVELPVELKLTHVPQNIVITTELEDTVHVTVRDKGYALLPYLWSKQEKSISVDFKTYANIKTGKGVFPLTDLYRQLYTKIFSSTKILSAKPDRLEFYFNQGQSKRVPVRIIGQIKPANNYYVSHMRVTPQTAVVYANRELLDSIHYVQTLPIKLTNFSDSLTEEVSLYRTSGIKIVPSKIQLTLYTDIQTEESLEIPITAINMPAGKLLRTFPSKARVHFVVGAKMFRQIRADQFRVVVDYNDIAANPSEKCTLKLRSIPQAVSKVRLDINQVDYLIEQK